MPRLNHTKTRNGCQRCKARKVKCDEGRPSCSACVKHSVSCEYTITVAVNVSRRPPPGPSSSAPRLAPAPTPLQSQLDASPGSIAATDVNFSNGHDARLELRLLHHWTSHTSQTFSPAIEYWQSQVSVVALKYRYCLDALLSLAALDLSRQEHDCWVCLDGRVINVKNPVYRDKHHPRSTLASAWKNLPNSWKVLGPSGVVKQHGSGTAQSSNATSPADYKALARLYFDRALEGQRAALSEITLENVEALFVTSTLLSFCALFTLSDKDADAILPNQDPLDWLHLAKGTGVIGAKWYGFVGETWMIDSGVFYGDVDLTDTDLLFNPQNSRAFGKLLTWAIEFETVNAEQLDAYSKVISYIGLIYNRLSEDGHSALGTSRMFIAMPTRCPSLFIDLVEAKRPRAMAMLAYYFSLMKLLARHLSWYEGIAERQVPRICAELPAGWQAMVAWPLAIARGEH